jgi:hypothetical protein
MSYTTLPTTFTTNSNNCIGGLIVYQSQTLINNPNPKENNILFSDSNVPAGAYLVTASVTAEATSYPLAGNCLLGLELVANGAVLTSSNNTLLSTNNPIATNTVTMIYTFHNTGTSVIQIIFNPSVTYTINFSTSYSIMRVG